jgi:hypothetical protein
MERAKNSAAIADRSHAINVNFMHSARPINMGAMTAQQPQGPGLVIAHWWRLQKEP